MNNIKINEAVNNFDMIIINLIKLNSHITRKELKDITKKSESTIYRTLIKLKEKSIIERVWSDKKGHWVIKE